MVRGKANGAPKPPRSPRGGAKAAASSGGDSSTQQAKGGDGRPLSPKDNADAIRALFLSDYGKWSAWRAEVDELAKVERDLKATIKNDGFTVKQFEIADALKGNPKQNAKIRSEVEDRLKVARWVGDPLGDQLDMFGEPDRTPSVDRAYDFGKQDSMEGKPATPPYAPETEQYRSYMQGFHDDTERRVKAGITPPDTDQTDTEDAEVEQPQEQPPVADNIHRLPSAAQHDDDPL